MASVCDTEHSPPVGTAVRTTGARLPMLNVELVPLLVKGPNALLSPAVNVVFTLRTALGPQAVNGKAVPGRPVTVARVPLIKLGPIGTTLVSGIVTSMIESPLLSMPSDNDVATVLPGRCSGTPPVSNPWQTVVDSFGKKPLPTTKISTGPSASIRNCG